ncbi:hypothetical protein ACVGWQ_18680, partial [Enterobacter hormaechei]
MLDYDFQASTLIAGTTGGSLSKRLIEAIRLAFVSTISIKKLSVGQSSCLDFDFFNRTVKKARDKRSGASLSHTLLTFLYII